MRAAGEGGCGALLRELRQSRRMSLGQLAERAVVAKSTVSRWEAGAYQPRLPELEAVLTALQASPSQRVEAMGRVQAPRAVGRLQGELAGRQPGPAGADAPVEDAGLLPAGGDLLRAMRHRRGLSQEQVAAQLQVRPSAVSYWEQSKTMPAPDRLATLFDLLGAQPEERAFMRDGRRFLAPPLQATAASLDLLEQTLQTLRNEVYAGESRAIDLRFLVLQSQLAPLARFPGKQSGRAARVLLTRVLAHYAEWLSWGNRRREAFRAADRAVEILQEDGGPLHTTRALPLAVHVLAAVTRQKDAPVSAAQAVELLQRWLSLGPDPGWENFLYRELADHAVDAGAIDSALSFSSRAQSAAEQMGEERAIRTSRKVRVRVLTRLGRYQEALALLPAEENPVPVSGCFEALDRADVLLGLEERDEAQWWVARAYELTSAYGCYHLRPRVDELARQL